MIQDNIISKYIIIHHIGDQWITDRKTLQHKVICNHKWATKINYKRNTTEVFSPYPSYDHMIDPLRDIIKGFYPDTQRFQTWFLVQNSERDRNQWHDHCTPNLNEKLLDPSSEIPLPPSMSSVFYMSMPENCGGISFKIDEEELTLNPKLGDLIFFPPWLLHKPLSNTHLNDPNKWRISININLFNT